MTVTPATFVENKGKQTKKDFCSCSISCPLIAYTQQLEILSELPAPNLKCQLQRVVIFYYFSSNSYFTMKRTLFPGLQRWLVDK